MTTHPSKCDICSIPFQHGITIVDGKMKGGQWAWMCATCFRWLGIGLGTGKGQMYSHGNPNKIGG